MTDGDPRSCTGKARLWLTGRRRGQRATRRVAFHPAARHFILPAFGLLLLAGCVSPSGFTPPGAPRDSAEAFNPDCYYLYDSYRTYSAYDRHGRYRPRYSTHYYRHGPYGPYCANPYIPYGRASMAMLLSGSMSNTGEKFTGTGTFLSNGRGILEIHSFDGSDCSGNFVFVDRPRAEGELQCSDGRTGTFRFTSNGVTGEGAGSLDRQPFNFTFAIN